MRVSAGAGISIAESAQADGVAREHAAQAAAEEGPRKPLPEELARDAIAHEDATPEGKVKLTFRVVLSRQQAEALAARAIQEEKNLDTLVAENLEAAAGKGKA